MSKEKIQISFNKKQSKLLRNESDRIGSSIASIVRLAVDDFFNGRNV